MNKQKEMITSSICKKLTTSEALLSLLYILRILPATILEEHEITETSAKIGTYR